MAARLWREWRASDRALPRGSGVSPPNRGTLYFAADGLGLDSAGFRFTKDGRPVSTAHLRFSRATIEGEVYPTLSERGATRLPAANRSRAMSRVELFAYSGYKRVP